MFNEFVELKKMSIIYDHILYHYNKAKNLKIKKFGEISISRLS